MKLHERNQLNTYNNVDNESKQNFVFSTNSMVKLIKDIQITHEVYPATYVDECNNGLQKLDTLLLLEQKKKQVLTFEARHDIVFFHRVFGFMFTPFIGTAVKISANQ